MSTNDPSKEELLAEIAELKKQLSEKETLLQNAVSSSENSVAQELLHKSILKTSNQGFWLADLQANLIEVNDHYCRMSGYLESELLTMKIPDLEARESQEDVSDHIKKIKTTGSDKFETIHKRKDGSVYDVEINVQLIKHNGEGKFVVFINDITSRKQVEESLRKSEERLQLALKVSKASMFENNFITEEVITSPELYLQLGYSLDEVPTHFSQTVSMVHPDDLTPVMESITAHAKGELPYYYSEFRMKTKSGEWRWIDGRGKIVKKTSGGDPEILMGISKDITDQKVAQQKLAESEARLKLSLQVNNATLFEDNFVTGKMITSPYLFERFGYSQDEIPQTINGAVELMHPDDQTRVFQDLNDHISGKTELYYTEYRMKDKYGKWRWIDGRGKITKWTDDGQPEIIIGLSQEITDRIEAEESLHQFEHIVAASSDMLALINLNYTYLTANSAYAQALGMQVEDFRNKSIKDVFGEQFFLDIIKPNLDKCMQGETVNYQAWFNFPVSGKQYMDIQYIPYYDQNSTRKGVVVNGRNITQKKEDQEALLQAKKQLEASESRYRLGLAAANIGVWNWEIGSEEIYFSDICKSHIGYSTNEMPNLFSAWENLIHPQDRVVIKQHILEYANTPKGTFSQEFRLQHKDGSYRWIHSKAEAVFGEGGDVKYLYGSHRDITDLKNAELELKRQNVELILAKDKAEESDKLKSSFLANMSHEIRTPMNGILGFSDLLKNPKLSGEEQLSYIDIIEQSGKRMLGIINDLIDISKVESGQMEIVTSDTNINDQVEYIYTFFLPEVNDKGMNLVKSTPLERSQANILTDREKVYAILTNLVKNAIKYSDSGTIEIGYTLKGEHIDFFVKDTGIGIPEDKLDSIFDRFIQADVEDVRAAQGAGLGLAITKAYVEMLGGTISVESELTRGSCFTFTLPYNQSNPVSQPSTFTNDLDEDIDGKRLKVLIAEDDEVSMHLLSVCLGPYSKDIISVNNGVATVEFAKANPDLDLILMDMKMPKMNGLDAVAEIRSFNEDVFIIAQTAFGFTTDKENAIKNGCNAYISKPINQVLLKEIIRKNLLKPE